MKNLFIALIALPAMGCNLDKDSGTEVAGLSCTETPDELSIEEESPLGFAGRAVVIDLDAHPPDGTAACLASDGRTWIGSISGSDWGALPGVSERCIPGADDVAYGRALAALVRCDSKGWCKLRVDGVSGWAPASELWGTDDRPQCR